MATLFERAPGPDTDGGGDPIAAPPPRTSSPGVGSWPRRGAPALGWLALVLLVAVSAWPLAPPDAVGAGAPSGAFSAGRAMTHLERIARQPRPTGSGPAADVRDYLRSTLAGLGMDTEIQHTTAIHEKQPTHFHAGVVDNVLGRKRGTGGGGAIVLCAHFDSVAAGPGANDDGVAVAAILEAARVLTAGPPLQHDLVVLFTDGEEFGLLGAHAFAEQHPWAADAKVLLNFEARGSGGPVVMFESSAGDADLVAGLAATSHPVASSVGTLVYRFLPNDTDFTVFDRAGIRGMNFAFIGDQVRYHDAADSLRSVDPDVVQHDGEYAVELTRHFDRHGAGTDRGAPTVYFTVPGLGLVHYPGWLNTVFTALALVGLCGAVIVGRSRGRLRLRRAAAALGLAVSGVVVSAAVVEGVWLLLERVDPDLTRFHAGDGYNGGLYLVGFGLLAVALSTTGLALGLRRWGLDTVVTGVAVLWALLLAGCVAVAPVAAYLFAWPLLAAVAGLGWRLLRGHPDDRAGRQVLAFAPAAAVTVVLFTPVLYLFGLAVGPALAVVGVPLLSAVLLVVFPVLRLDRPLVRRWTPVVAAVMAVAVLVATVPTGDFGPGRPKPGNVFYALDADTGQAIWGVLDADPDPWQEQLVEHYRAGPMPTYFRMPLGFHVGQAPAAALAAPEATVLSNTVTDGIRTVRLRLKAGRPAPMVEIISLSPAKVRAATIDGRRVVNTAERDPYGFRWSLHYIAPPADGVEVTIEVESSAPFPVRLLDRSYSTEEIPELRGAVRRPPNTMPGNEDGDFVVVSRGMVIE
ncbi:M20/M25/M40 family metallo-hydrolase [Micromonospora sp. NPDC048999]|uniref:M20/M25/M40 family metallo-hydrolase n=1 Tax=Micromonospora sp. NPDC048999 TaxID=3155391 RepID=UPI00340A5D77